MGLKKKERIIREMPIRMISASASLMINGNVRL